MPLKLCIDPLKIENVSIFKMHPILMHSLLTKCCSNWPKIDFWNLVWPSNQLTISVTEHSFNKILQQNIILVTNFEFALCGIVFWNPEFMNLDPIQLGAVFSPKVGDYGPPFCSVLGCRTACSHIPSYPPLYVVTPDTALTSSASSSLCNPFQNTF